MSLFYKARQFDTTDNFGDIKSIQTCQCSIQNRVKDIVSFLGLKVFHSDNFYMFFCCINCASL